MLAEKDNKDKVIDAKMSDEEYRGYLVNPFIGTSQPTPEFLRRTSRGMLRL